MLRWMCGHTLMDRIIGTKSLERKSGLLLFAKMYGNVLRWHGHLQRKTFDSPVRRIESIIVEGKRSRGRPKRTWEKQIKVELYELHPLWT